jgi:serine/threonine-protein kinase HipA
LKNIADKPVLIVRRFDRAGSGRIPFLSAMSLLGAKDNEPHTYLDLAYAIGQHSPQPKADLHELWRRIVFTVMISNTDDHLRNHGFLYTDGWRLSPVYDINPTPRHIKSKILSTAIDFNTNVASLEVALSVAEDFRLSLSAAKDIIINVRNAVKQWRTVATQMGLSKPEQDDMASAFSDDDGLL